MKLLLDQNLSYRLISELNEWFPGSIHVYQAGMETSVDKAIWDYAKENGYIIVSKDSDFHQRSFLYGAPPKVIWIEKGNCSTQDVYIILKNSREVIETFGKDPDSSFLIL